MGIPRMMTEVLRVTSVPICRSSQSRLEQARRLRDTFFAENAID